MIKLIISSLLVPLPMFIKRILMRWIFGYQIHHTARIGLALVCPRQLCMEAGTSIGHFTVMKSINVTMRASSTIGRGNWITGHPLGGPSFEHVQRDPTLMMEEHSAIAHRHIIDCTDKVTIGRFATVAGWMSQIMTHSIDLTTNRQSCRPISIGSYSFVGTRVIMLGGSRLPDYSVLGAGSLLNKDCREDHCLFAGVPARKIKQLPGDMAYFSRAEGHVS